MWCVAHRSQKFREKVRGGVSHRFPSSLFLYSSGMWPVSSSPSVAALVACTAVCAIGIGAARFKRRSRIVPKTAQAHTQAHTQEQVTGPGNGLGSETGCSYEPYEPEPYEPFEVGVLKSETDDGRWLAVVERLALLHEEMRGAAAAEAATHVRLLVSEVRSLEAALYVSEKKRASEQRAWRRRAALLLTLSRYALSSPAARVEASTRKQR